MTPSKALARDNAPSDERRSRKAELGQFFTPLPIAHFMAAMFPDDSLTDVHLLDAGAGHGALSAALLSRLRNNADRESQISVTAYEFDDAALPHLQRELSRFNEAVTHVIAGDFIQHAVRDINAQEAPAFSHAILNPPYKKIGSASQHRTLLRHVGIETVNLYSAFVALALLRLRVDGYLCAIVPRSFCNGPYYRRFRQVVLSEAALRRIHLFGARDKAFSRDSVLQENVIIVLQRGAKQGGVEISFSTDDSLSDLTTRRVPFHDVVKPHDRDQMIYVPYADNAARLLDRFNTTLTELAVQVSTGPVVDFRLKEHLRRAPGSGTVPLVYPAHFGASGYSWPYGNPKKPSAIIKNAETEKWLFPAGNYTVVRRLSSKEERRRIVANVVPNDVTPALYPAGTGIRPSSNAPDGRPSSSSFCVHRAA